MSDDRARVTRHGTVDAITVVEARRAVQNTRRTGRGSEAVCGWATQDIALAGPRVGVAKDGARDVVEGASQPLWKREVG